MAIYSYDIVSTLQALGMIKYWKGKHIVLKKQDVLEDYQDQTDCESVSSSSVCGDSYNYYSNFKQKLTPEIYCETCSSTRSFPSSWRLIPAQLCYVHSGDSRNC
uniref:Histone acetyltransferase n=1 Tax=Megaselia scalaris TaxID=36166 RepID=T1GN86_MEGSC